MKHSLPGFDIEQVFERFESLSALDRVELGFWRHDPIVKELADRLEVINNFCGYLLGKIRSQKVLDSLKPVCHSVDMMV